MAGGGGNKKRFQYCFDSSATILYFRALQGHSGRNLVDPSLQDNCCSSPVAKRLTILIRHGQLPPEDDGAIELWRLQDHLRNHFVQSQHWSDEKWKSTVAKGGGNKKRFQYCTDTSIQEILYLRALLGVTQGAMSLILHCRTMFQFRTISSSTFYHIGYAINLHSIMNSGLIPG